MGTRAQENDLFVVKYNSSVGTGLWTQQLGTPSADNAYGVATDTSGNVYVAGRTEGGLDGKQQLQEYDLFVVIQSSDENKQ